MLTYAEAQARRAAIREGHEMLLDEMAGNAPEGGLKPGQMLAAEWLLEWQARAAHGYTYAHMVIGPALPFPSGMDDADAIFDHGRRAA